MLYIILLQGGITRRKVFDDNADRDFFVDRLGSILSDTGTLCFAWALIPNHFHLLLKTGATPIATVLKRLLTGYAMYYNRTHKRSGHLFQNRYKSIVCQEDVYLKELVRYIHLNPVRAGIVGDLKELNKYPYCGHSALMGRKKRLWQDVDYVLGYFGIKVSSARKGYLGYVEAGLEQGRRDELTGGGLIRSLGGWSKVKRLRLNGQVHMMSDERILGDSEFVDSVLSLANEKYERRFELKQRGYDLDRIVERVAEIYEMDLSEVMSKGKQQRKVMAKSLLCFWAVREAGISLRELARRLEMSPPGVGYAVERGEVIAKNKSFKLVE